LAYVRREVSFTYVLEIDVAEDSLRKSDATPWSDFFELSLRRLAIRKAPL
jgi:hypothetical protein